MIIIRETDNVVYKLYNDVEGYSSIDFSNINIGNIIQGLTSIKYISGKNFSWNIDEDNDIKGDCPFYLGAFPIFKFNKINGFDFINSETSVFKVDNEKFIAVLAPALSQLLDKEKSDIRFFKNGKVLNIRKFVFKKDCKYPPIFRIEECPIYTFVDKNMMKSLSKLGFTQLRFEKCY